MQQRAIDDSPIDRPGERDGNDPSWRIGHRAVAITAGLVLVLGLSLTVVRIVTQYQTPGPFTPERQGLCDFHNGIYYPTRAVLAGESPYSDAYAAKYPVARQIPFFSPVILLLHAPLAILPLHLAEVLNHLLQWSMLAAIACLVAAYAGMPRRWDAVLVIAAAMVFSRGGHITLFNGYFTFQLVLATYLAIAWAERKPMGSAIALLVVSGKPTYLLPLGFLMLARGNFRALVLGALLSVGGAAAGLGWIAHHEGGGDLFRGAEVVRAQIAETQTVHRSMEDESPVFSWTRLDLFAIVAKWRGEDPGELPHLLAMLALLVIPMILLAWRRRRGEDDDLGGLTGALMLTAVLVSLYHQSYDSLLLAAPLAALSVARRPVWANRSRWLRFALMALLACPAVNYLSTRMFLQRFEISELGVRIVTSLNGVALAVALVMLCVVAWPRSPTKRLAD